ncbi:MAG: crossover junction endodeoxyribonuclease RuvC [Firmicutes bacterium]|nr:crossover junction endodeoxyribonuclease RuvC [Bacillota bacterium]MCD7832084.1 crossover junction endodeoxyribonuclease RuvC [Bacillota bacterium]MCD8311593.1 crossover junction endodeoxyribonuclease RuvC [Bacillota bacterium]
MKILGVDPGIAIAGWGVVDFENGKFRTLGYDSATTPAGMKTEDRLLSLFRDFELIINHYRPDEFASEELFWNTNQKTGIMVAEARGVILMTARKHGIPVFEYTPLQVKQAVVGYGRATKKQVIMMTTSILNLKETPKPDDTADALAVAICHAHSSSSPLGKYYNM